MQPSPEELSQQMLAAVEEELRQATATIGGPGLSELHAILAYHMGWEGGEAGSAAQGKRIRPLLLLLCCAAAEGEWQKALPAAAAVELVHNFSLIHDDIEDNSPLRRGRETVWKRWGIAQAVNAGDSMFALAHSWLQRIAHTTSPDVALQGSQILLVACIHLTQGQYLDLSYESRLDLRMADYWPMIRGKTAALLAACTELGALIAGAEDEQRAAYHAFGQKLGLAFQAQDDLLGIWGDAELTGKSAESDLATGKKSLPVLFGLEKRERFYQRWQQGLIPPGEVPEVAALLEEEGARQHTQETADRLTQEALQALETAQPRGAAGTMLRELAHRLLRRQT
ncbi:MAG: polyprenyl synthetase family protein [Anaerolineales bacterium]|nr:polyprenyl synthetase family protein [Anaerolineales bacterium]